MHIQCSCGDFKETCARHSGFKCKPGPHTVLLEEEEDKLTKYLVKMADLGYGLRHDTVMQMAFNIADKNHRKHPFQHKTAGRAWFEGFLCLHPKPRGRN